MFSDYFREISGMNIIVDQAVNGTLTLALNDVPWEFALDVIMNLTGLQKVERSIHLSSIPKIKISPGPNRQKIISLSRPISKWSKKRL